MVRGGTSVSCQVVGWINMDLFKGWFNNHFLRHAVSAQPLLLLMDGHSSHYNPEAIRLTKDNDVILFTLVPHTTHEMQPLDTSVFGSLKAHWKSACHNFMQKSPNKAITKYQFSPLLNQAWCQTMVPSSVINGFMYCGVHPFNPQAVLNRPKFTTSKSAKNSQAISESISTPSDSKSTSSESLGYEDQEPALKRKTNLKNYTKKVLICLMKDMNCGCEQNILMRVI